MNEIDHFKKFILCSGDVAIDVYNLHVKRIHLVCFSYIVRISSPPNFVFVILSDSSSRWLGVAQEFSTCVEKPLGNYVI
jgi:hypothetical protein